MSNVDYPEALAVLRDAIEYNETGRSFADIERVLAWWYAAPRSWDERDGAWLVEFKDGQRGLFLGGHDSTGWDCQSTLDCLPLEGWEERIRSRTYPSWDNSSDGVVAAMQALLYLSNISFPARVPATSEKISSVSDEGSASRI